MQQHLKVEVARKKKYEQDTVGTQLLLFDLIIFIHHGQICFSFHQLFAGVYLPLSTLDSRNQ